MSSGGTNGIIKYVFLVHRTMCCNTKPGPGYQLHAKRKRGIHGGKTHGCGSKGSGQRQNFMRLGYETGSNPFYLRFPCQNLYKGHHLRLSYVPLTLTQLQLTVDVNRIDTNGLVDVTTLMASALFKLSPLEKEGGFSLLEEGLDNFKAKLNLEVQWATEPVIAAIERNGGTITTAYYDPISLTAAVNPEKFFQRSEPIPRRMLPPQDLIDFYSDPRNRGYLADPEDIAKERLLLAQKYGYKLPDENPYPNEQKDPRQVFLGLEPGWIVNLREKVIMKPTDPELLEFYAS
ncbi:unnamed protein product, partial [Meganyctiphanes norvegica]